MNAAKKLPVYFSMLMASFTASAQCVTSSLPVNTGYTTSGPLALGTNDAHWNVVGLSAGIVANVIPTPPTPPYPAVVAGGGGWGANDPNSSWISFYNPTGAWYHTTALPTTYSMKLQRTFTLCQDDKITVNVQVARDNYINYLKIDGNPSLLTDPPGQVTAYFNTWTTITPVSYTLTAGTHTIEVEVVDFHDASMPNQANPHGFNLVGTVSSAGGNNSIIDDQNCGGYVCNDGCSDECFWKLSGNNILNNRNFFGTRTNDNVRVLTNNTLRGILTNNGLFGWNTMSPTAYMHVLCTGNNPDDGSAGSDVRFENLEPGNGNILVIDPSGYVYNSRIPVNGGPAGDPKLKMLYQEEKAKTEALEGRVAELEGHVKQLLALHSKDAVTPAANGNTLGQNIPNPFGNETVIPYTISDMQQSAYLMVNDLNGRELLRYSIPAKGKGSLTVNSEKLVSGVYMYSLVVDGKEVDSKRMVLSK